MQRITFSSLFLVATFLCDKSGPVDGYWLRGQPKPRDYSNDETVPGAWSNWVTVMKPRGKADSNWAARDGGYGLRTSALRNHFPSDEYECGTYEVRATKKGQPSKTVYAGRSCRNKRSLYEYPRQLQGRQFEGGYVVPITISRTGRIVQAERTDKSPVATEYEGINSRTKRAIYERFREYTGSGSHKKDLIKQALDDGYELQVRAKPSANRGKSVEDEAELLSRYNYPWNVKNNGKLRYGLRG